MFPYIFSCAKVNFLVLNSMWYFSKYLGILKKPKLETFEGSNWTISDQILVFWKFLCILKNTTLSLILECWLLDMTRCMESRNSHLKSSVHLDLHLKSGVLHSKMSKLLFSAALSIHSFYLQESIWSILWFSIHYKFTLEPTPDTWKKCTTNVQISSRIPS